MSSAIFVSISWPQAHSVTMFLENGAIPVFPGIGPDLRSELKDTKVPTNGCWARRADVNVLFTQWKPSQ